MRAAGFLFLLCVVPHLAYLWFAFGPPAVELMNACDKGDKDDAPTIAAHV